MRSLATTVDNAAAFGALIAAEQESAASLLVTKTEARHYGELIYRKTWTFPKEQLDPVIQEFVRGARGQFRIPIGAPVWKGKVWKGKKMAGQLGNERVTVQSLEIVRVDAERNLLLVKGAVPGATDCEVIVRSAVKAR